MSALPATDTDEPLPEADAVERGIAVAERLSLALEQTQEALGQIQRIAVEEIRIGLRASDHVEAAERDMRDALRQLVIAERELRSHPLPPASLSRPTIVIGES